MIGSNIPAEHTRRIWKAKVQVGVVHFLRRCEWARKEESKWHRMTV